MIEITISDEIRNACPDLRICTIMCDVRNTEHNEGLWKEITEIESAIRTESNPENNPENKQTNTPEAINKIPTIKATRQAYKALGKDPNRYRPSAESLHRRIHKGMPLYRINTLVDLINLVSIKTGYSIGAFDATKIQGNLCLGIGTEGEMYRGIGRGKLNIAGLPVYRDNISGIGTPTSDEERTKIEPTTSKLLIIINAYSGPNGLQETATLTINLLKKYAKARNIITRIV